MRFSFATFLIITLFAQADETLPKRKAMIQSQIIARGVKDEQVLKALMEVPRHEFVPKAMRKHAYADHPLPIGEDQTISQPFIVAKMTELMKVDSKSKVLEIGTGSGYQAAVLAKIVKQVYSIEIVEALAKRSKALLARLGYKNVAVLHGDGYRGWPEHAPFDAIIVTAAPDHVPQALVEQLSKGGRLVIPVGDRYQELLLITKDEKGKVKREKIFGVRFVPMTGKAQEKGDDE